MILPYKLLYLYYFQYCHNFKKYAAHNYEHIMEVGMKFF